MWGLSTLARHVYYEAGEIICLDLSDRINSDGAMPLELAAQSRYLDVVSVLLDLGGKLTDYTGIQSCCWKLEEWQGGDGTASGSSVEVTSTLS